MQKLTLYIKNIEKKLNPFKKNFVRLHYQIKKENLISHIFNVLIQNVMDF